MGQIATIAELANKLIDGGAWLLAKLRIIRRDRKVKSIIEDAVEKKDTSKIEEIMRDTRK